MVVTAWRVGWLACVGAVFTAGCAPGALTPTREAADFEQVVVTASERDTEVADHFGDASESEALLDPEVAVIDEMEDWYPGLDMEAAAADIDEIQPWARVIGMDRSVIETPANFGTAKRILYDDIHVDHPWSLYCGCAFPTGGGSGAPRFDHASCAYEAQGDPGSEAAKRIDAEHIVPAAVMGQGRDCWDRSEAIEACVIPRARKGRDCCEHKHVDPAFFLAHQDLHNLFGAVGEVNNRRLNYPYTETTHGVNQFGGCDFEMITPDPSDRRSKFARPAAAVRGEIARATLYMLWAHDIAFHVAYVAMMVRWDADDPPECWEVVRSYRVALHQGLGNPFIDYHPEAPSLAECGVTE